VSYDFDGTSAAYRCASAVVTTTPLTFACWFNSDSFAAQKYLMSAMDESSGTLNGFVLAVSTLGRAVAFTFGSGTQNSANSTAGGSTGVWGHAAAVYTSSTSRRAYYNGGSEGTNSTARAPANAPDNVVLANYRTNAYSSTWFDGRIADAAVWNTDLTAAEVAELGKGVSPLKVRPQSLVWYAPLIRDLVEIRQGLTLTANGSPSAYTDHPRTFGL